MNILTFLLALSTPALAAENTTVFSGGDLLRNTSGTYSALFLGPTVRRLDGDKLDGRGHYSSFRNYLSFENKFAESWKAETGWEVRQNWRPVDKKNPDRKEFEMRDPYLGVGRSDLYRGDIFSVGAKARFYLPVTEYNKSKVGKAEDAGNGEINAGFSPNWRFRDGDFSVGCNTEVFVKIPENAPELREKYSVRAKPLVAYRITNKYIAKVEYQTGYLRRMTNGHWTKFNDAANGHKLYVGLSWLPNDALNLSPAINWGSETFRLDRTELSLFASYAFL